MNNSAKKPSDMGGAPTKPRDVALDRVMEVGLRAHYGRERAPDLTARILDRVNDPNADHSKVDGLGALTPHDAEIIDLASVRRASSRRWLERSLVAAGIIGVVSASAFLMYSWGDKGVDGNAPLDAGLDGDVNGRLGVGQVLGVAGISALESVEWRKADNGFTLDRGWILVESAPDPVWRDGEQAWVPDGRAIMRAGGVPSPVEVEGLLSRVSAIEASSPSKLTEWEKMFMRNPTNWSGRGALSVCLLAGVGMVNGQPLLAQAAGGEAKDGVSVMVASTSQIAEWHNFDMLDKNKDGVIDTTELAEVAIKVVDKNADGKISKEEFPEKGVFIVTAHEKDGTSVVKGAFETGTSFAHYVVKKPDADGEAKADGDVVVEVDVVDTDNISMGRPSFPLGTLGRVFTALDVNSDGKLDGAETGAGLMKVADKDGDALVSRQELQAVMSSSPSADDAEIPTYKATFAALDSNGDGRLSDPELPRAAIEILDTDKDGILTLEEFQSATRLASISRWVAREGDGTVDIKYLDVTFTRLDKDSNGSLTAQELADFKTDKQLDTDGDGIVSRAEWDASMPKPRIVAAGGSVAGIGGVEIDVVVDGSVDTAAIQAAVKRLEEQVKKAPPEAAAELAKQLADIRVRLDAAVKAAAQATADVAKAIKELEEAKPSAPKEIEEAKPIAPSDNNLPAPPGK